LLRHGDSIIVAGRVGQEPPAVRSLRAFVLRCCAASSRFAMLAYWFLAASAEAGGAAAVASFSAARFDSNASYVASVLFKNY
jgi:hypothetical protein